MNWNWQHPDWPRFRYSPGRLVERESLFLRQSGVVVGTVRHLPETERLPLVVELMSTEALKTSEIEGDLLDRDSVQSSLRRQFGLQTDGRRVEPAEQGIAELLTDLYRTFAALLDEDTLFRWHRWVTQGRTDLRVVGGYRTHPEPMLVVLSPKEFNERTGIVIGLPMTMTTATFNETNPFAVKLNGPKGAASYILGHQPKSFDWRARNAKPHPWKKVPEEPYALACETLNQIVDIGT